MIEDSAIKKARVMPVDDRRHCNKEGVETAVR